MKKNIVRLLAASTLIVATVVGIGANFALAAPKNSNSSNASNASKASNASHTSNASKITR